MKHRGYAFPSPVGIGSGLITTGIGIDNMLLSSGVDSASGLSTFVEIGTCTAEKQTGRHGMPLKRIDVDFRREKVTRVNTSLTPSISQIIANLLERQQRIINGQISYVNKDNLIGVNVKA